MKTIKELIKQFQNTQLKSTETLHVELSEKELDNIGLKSLLDLSQAFFMRMLNPTCRDGVYSFVFERLDTQSSFHNAEQNSEKYGVGSEFFSIDKTKEFSFLYYYQEALKFVGIKDKKTILNLGINKADEFRVIKDMLSKEQFLSKKFVGIDYSQSAIVYAKEQMRDENIEFLCADINDLESISLPRFDLLISIGTLQSSNINFNERFMYIFQNHLEKNGSIVLGFPNCRWIDGEMIYGAKAPNYSFNEMSLVLKDIHFCKKYLQQKKYRVVITGKDYLFLSARKIESSNTNI
jgi:2-polyprenyl-3-methyl-5-hydroxy-6-metoxy-1,4-benzoquinol methylase